MHRTDEGPGNAAEKAAEILARVVCVLLGCAVALTLFENLMMIKTLAQV